MKIRIINICVVVLLSFFAYAVQLTFGQSHKARNSKMLWSPPDKSFTVEVPVKLKEDKETYKDESRSGYNSIKLYGAEKSNYVFLVYVLELVNKEKKLSSKDKFAGLEFVLGGDDDHEFTEKFLKIDSLTAKEIIYANRNSRGLMIDAGDKILVVN